VGLAFFDPVSECTEELSEGDASSMDTSEAGSDGWTGVLDNFDSSCYT
jgi:hypothetical protein